MAVITRLDPLTYGVDGLRGALISRGTFSAALNVAVLARDCAGLPEPGRISVFED